MLNGSVGITLSVIADACLPPERVETEGAQDNIGVVDLVVLTDPSSSESPEALHGR